MTVQSFTVQLSTRLYNRLKQRADRTNRSIEIEMVEAVAGALPADDMLPTELADALAHLAAAEDDMLLRATKARFLRRNRRGWRRYTCDARMMPGAAWRNVKPKH